MGYGMVGQWPKIGYTAGYLYTPRGNGTDRANGRGEGQLPPRVIQGAALAGLFLLPPPMPESEDGRVDTPGCVRAYGMLFAPVAV